MDRLVSFSDTVSASKVIFSPNGHFVAYCVDNHERLWIRHVQEELSIFTTFNTLFGSIGQIEWSLDSIYIACGSTEDALIQVFSLADQDRKWKCKIDIGNELEGGVGLLNFCWSPKTRHLLTTACHHVQLTVWSLEEKHVHYIKDILPIRKYKSFSPDGNYLAVAKFDISDGKKFIHIYDTSDWENSILSFSPCAKDMDGIRWCPDMTIVIWDSALFSNFYIYSRAGQLMKHYSPDGLSLGIQSIEFSLTGQFIAFTNHKDQFRIMNTISYGISLDEILDESLPPDYPQCSIYAENIGKTFPNREYKYKYEIQKELCPTNAGLEPIILKTKLKFNWDGKLISVYTPSFSNTIWIWDISTTKLISVLKQQKPITDFHWHPTEDCLCVVTGKDCLYFWTPNGCYIVCIPEDGFIAKTLQWNLDGRTLLAKTSGSFINCYLQQLLTNSSRSESS